MRGVASGRGAVSAFNIAAFVTSTNVMRCTSTPSSSRPACGHPSIDPKLHDTQMQCSAAKAAAVHALNCKAAGDSRHLS